MSTAPMLREFLVIIPDKPSVRKTRLALRSVPDLEDDPTKFDFMGSTFVCRAESRAVVFEQVRQDVYASGGVWDLARVSDASSSVSVIENE
ncbi:hypothetical protein E4U33_000653 [Claviceps sp. LM78 group G4]|nr:hypothetical protein E4U33_000653 [Claviceps sp. LM78 group G4]